MEKKLESILHDRFAERVTVHKGDPALKIECPTTELVALADLLFNEHQCAFGGLFIDENDADWILRYLFYCAGRTVTVIIRAPVDRTEFPSISSRVHAADWHERVAEDLFGISFSGHPRLGEFVLHEQWPEGTNPMRRRFSANERFSGWESHPRWEPPRVLDSPGAFSMPIGPIYSGASESVHFQLETVGEEIVRMIPRLFYKYRAVEAIARGRSVDDVLLLAERFNGTSSFAHALAFCQAVEKIGGVEVPQRAQLLRIFIAELERIRHHVAAIHGICASTGLAIAGSQADILEEETIRISGAFTGHRYLFGLALPGGLSRDFSDEGCRGAAAQITSIAQRLKRLEDLLAHSSSFLDRLEQIGIVPAEAALGYGLVGPIARASGFDCDLRVHLPYGGYGNLSVQVPREREGDGYARLRVLFAEARESARILSEIAEKLPLGEVRVPVNMKEGEALGWTEAPAGGAFHWIKIDVEGKIAQWRVIPPSFVNWHGFHLAAEGFAFQDFPIILATFGLSAAENDR